MQNILVLCIGNICRSPLAEGLLSHALPARRIWSAGLQAVIGAPADPMSVELAQAGGIDITRHRAQQVTSFMCQQADLILVMETRQRSELERRYPVVRGKVFLYGEHDIDDPHRLPRAAFEQAYADIARGTAAWVERLGRLA